MALGDSNDIFSGRPSTAPLNGEDNIIGSENKKPGSKDNKKRMKKTVLRKINKASAAEAKNEDSAGDDGFRNYGEDDANASGKKLLH